MFRITCVISVSALFVSSHPSSAQTCVSTAAAVNSDASSDAATHHDRLPVVATDGQGVWIAVWAESSGVAESNIAYSRSLDDGQTWSARTVLTIPGFFATAPDVVSNKGDNWAMVFAARGGDGIWGVYRRQSADDGLSWSSPEEIDGAALTEDANPVVEYDSSQSRFIVFWSSRNSLGGSIGDDHDILFTRGESNGSFWIFTGPLNPDATTDSIEDYHPSAASDDQGNWVVGWQRTYCNQFGCFASDVHSVRSLDAGVSWQSLILVSSDAGRPSVATDRKGVWVTAFAQGSPEIDIGFSRSTNNGGSWSVASQLNPNAPYDDALIVVDQNVRIAADEDHNWIAVWESDFIGEGLAGNDREIFVARSYDAGQTWTDQAYANSTAFTDGVAFDAEPAIAVDYLRGRWVIVWQSQADFSGTGSDYDILVTTITAPTFYVDEFTDCNFACGGTGWQFAYDELSSALSNAAAAGGAIIRVANGTYRPDSSGLADPRDATFTLPGCTRIMGGFAGDNAPNPDARDVDAFPTTLSGDIGTSSTADDCYTVVTGDSNSIESVLSGLTITRGNSNNGDRPGGLYQSGGSLILEEVAIINNLSVGRVDNLLLENVPKLYLRALELGTDMSGGFAGKIVSSNRVYVSEVLTLDSSLQLYDTGIVNGEPLLPDAPGSIHLAPDSRFAINALDESIVDPSQSSARIDQITGSGTVELSVGQGFVFTGVMDLQGDAPPGATCDDPAATAQWGELKVLGELRLDGALIEHARINNFDDAETPEDCGSYVGGKLISISASEIRDCDISVRGDRYFEFDSSEAQNAFVDSCLTVQSSLPASFGEQGRLYEARSEDVTYDTMSGPYTSGAFQVPSTDPGLNGIWTVDELHLTPGTRMDIVNQEDYTPGNGLPETVYVRNLILDDNAVLNTAFNRIYYENLSQAPSASIVDIPLLGFSLGIVDFENECDYELRVRRQGNVERIPTADGYALRISSTYFNRGWIKGTFARAEGDSIVVAFDYRFDCPFPIGIVGQAWIDVFLSDVPTIQTNEAYQIARVFAPPQGQPGAFGSLEYASFVGVFPKMSLDWTQGTYVALRHVSTNTSIASCVDIDNFDPAIDCSEICGDLTGEGGISRRDYLYRLAEFGQAITPFTTCLDSSRTGRDYYGDLYDIVAFDVVRQDAIAMLDSCGLVPPDPASSPSAPTLPADSLVVCGKGGQPSPESSFLYPIAEDGLENGPRQNCPSRSQLAGSRGDFRLISDSTGELHQLHAGQGLIRMGDATLILAPSVLEFSIECNSGPELVDVVLGPVAGGMVGQFSGLPFMDVAFDPSDPNAVFVAPAMVMSPCAPCPYPVVARVDLAGVEPTVTQLFGEDPRSISTVQPFGCDAVYDPDLTNIREIEVDDSGHLFVVAANSIGGDRWLRIWNTSDGTEMHRVALTNLLPSITGPTAMLVTADDQFLYLGDSIADGSASTAEYHKFSINTAVTPPLTHVGTFLISGMEFITAATEFANQIIVVGFDYLPTFDPNSELVDDDQDFTMPVMATLSSSPGMIAATPILAGDLTIPLGVGVSSGNSSSCLIGDADADGSVTNNDIGAFVGFLIQPPSDPVDTCRADIDEDGDVDGADIGGFVICVLSGGC